jgi:hypothetical protein
MRKKCLFALEIKLNDDVEQEEWICKVGTNG